MFKPIFRVAAHTANIAALTGMIAAGAFYLGEASAEPVSIPDPDIKIVNDEEFHCLQQNIYWEAGNQSTNGKVAVAWVTLNRVESDRYPDTVCGVVKQGVKNSDGSMKRHLCQFSWYCDGKSDRVPNNVLEQRAWEDSGLVAEVVLLDWAQSKPGPVQDAVMYHADYVNPFWAASYNVVTQIESHIFYN